MTTECAHCNRKFKTFEVYAQHILDKHSDDDIRVEWAKALLNHNDTPEVVAEVPKGEMDEIDTQLAAVLRPEVLERLRSTKAPPEVVEGTAREIRSARRGREEIPKPAPAGSPKTGRGFHWPLIVVMGIIIFILLFALCRIAY